jgi:hypothetical protein
MVFAQQGQDKDDREIIYRYIARKLRNYPAGGVIL